MIDFRRRKRAIEQVEIKGATVERANTYKYLGVVFNDKLTWTIWTIFHHCWSN